MSKTRLYVYIFTGLLIAIAVLSLLIMMHIGMELPAHG